MRKRYFGRLLSIVLSATLAFTSAVPAHAMSPTEGEIPDETVTDEDVVDPEVTDEEKPEETETPVIPEEPEVTQNLPAQEEVPEEVLEEVPEDIVVEPLGEANNDVVVFESYDEGDDDLLGASSSVTINVEYVFSDGTDPLDGVTNPTSNKTSYPVQRVAEPGTITLAEPSKTFYAFQQFAVASDDVPTIEIEGNVITIPDLSEYEGSTIALTVTGVFDPKEFAIEIDGVADDPWIYNPEGYEIAPLAPVVGHTFEGWHVGTVGTTPTGTNRLTPPAEGDVNWVYVPKASDASKEKLSFFSNVTVNTYNVVYKLNSGTNNTKNKTSYKYSDLEGGIITFYAPTKANYTFDGWYLEYENEVYGSPIEPREPETDGEEKIWPYEIATDTPTTLTVYAKFDPAEYKVKFADVADEDYNNPNVIEGYVYGQPIELAAATWDHHDFVGWYTDAKFTNAVPATETGWTLTKPTGDLTFYPKFAQYNINYVLNGGVNDSENPLVFAISDGTIELKAPEKLDYEFEGWYTDSSFKNSIWDEDSGEYVYTIKSTDKKTLTFYAKWKETSGIRIPINYVLNEKDAKNNSGNPVTVIVEDNKEVTLYPATKTGYDFVGWYVLDENGEEDLLTPGANDTWVYTIASALEARDAGKLTFYGKLEPSTIPIIYMGKGTEGVASTNVTYGGVYPANMLTVADLGPNPGYAFEGWYSDATLKSKIVPGTTALPKTAPDAYYVYAKWTEKTYTANFHSNLAKDTKVTKKFKFTTDKEFVLNPQTIFGKTLIPDSKMGDFEGWALSLPDVQGPYNEATTVNELIAEDTSNSVNVTVDFYAQWPETEEYYVVKFNAGNITGDAADFADSDFDITEGLIQYKVVFVDEDYALTGKEFARTGYTLTGWTYEDSKGKKVTLKPTATFKNIAAEGETVELTAKWSGPASYTVKFNLNGGKFTGEGTLPSKYTYDNTVTLPVVEDMTKTGYKFTGWKLDGTYASVTKIGKGGEVPVGNVALIATWTPITYSVNFEENGGTIASVAPGVAPVPLADITTAIYDRTYSLKESDLVYSRDGYTFKNWTYLGDDGKVKTIAANGIIKNITATDGKTVDVTANWNPVKYTISYQNISGAKLATSSKSYTPDKLSDVFVGIPTKTGYEFGGWTISYDKKGGNNIALEADVNEKLEDGFTFTEQADAYGNVILTAVWTAADYNLDVYDSEGDVKIGTVQRPYDAVINFSELAAELTDSIYEDEGKSVKGFAISSKNALKGTVKYALGKNYKVSDIVSAAKPYDDTIDLYVVTENEKYFIKSGVIIDGGAYSESTVINYDKSKGYTITPAKKPGYTFVKWTLEDGIGNLPGSAGVDYTINANTNALTIAKNTAEFKFTEIAANYVSNTYTVVLLPNASDVEDNSSVVPTTGVDYTAETPVKQSSIADIVEPAWTRNGYDLDGFALTAKGTKLANFGGLYAKADKNGIVKVYALWTPTVQDIDYAQIATVKNVGTLPIDSEVAAIKANLWKQKTGSAVTLPTLKVTGYKFLGWKLTGDNENVTLNKDGYATKVNASNYENVELTAEFEENTYKLTLNTNGSFYTGTAGGKTYNNYKGTIVLKDKVRYSEDILPLVEAAAYDFDKAGCYGIGSFHSMAFAAKANYKQANQWLDSYYDSTGGTIILRSTKDVTIYPQLTTISVAKAADVRAIYEDDDLTVYWANLGNAAGFEIQYATNPLFLFGAQTEQADDDDVDATIPGLTAKKYYVRVRQYVPDSTGARVYGAWSSSVSAAKAYANVVDFTVASDNETNINLGTRKAAVGEKVLKALGTPVVPGYDFVGWYEEATCETKVKSSDVTTGTGSYYAKLTPSKFKVSFSWGTGATGGAKLSPIEVTYKGEYPDLPEAGNVKKTGYTFVNWSFDGENPVVKGDEVLITSNATLVPIWEPVDYTVSYDLNYPTSDAAPSPATVTFATTYEDAASADATRVGYILKGWYTSKSGGTKVLPTTKVTTAKDHTLYAQWEVESYSVKFVANAPEGSVATGKMADEVYKYTDSKALTANAYKVTGYTFDGWATAEDGTVAFTNKQIISGYSTLIGNVDEHNTYTLYGVWKPVEYTLTIVVGQKKSNVTVKAAYGENVLEALGNATLPEIEGMETDGNFYISSTFNTANMVKDTAKVAGAKTYYVRWVEANPAP